jgi:predicted AlkP superfamily phosphohydrolase/phosphomutase
MDSPGFTYPAEFVTELRAKFPDVDPKKAHFCFDGTDRLEEMLASKRDSIRLSGKLSRWLYAREDWDCFVTVFTETDAVAHNFWHLMDERHPLHDPDAPPHLKTAILDVYKAVDQEIGQLLALLPQETHVFVMSDHGVQINTRGALFLKGLMQQMGLEVQGDTGNRAFTLGRRLWHLLPRRVREKGSNALLENAPKLRGKMMIGDIDLSRTRAYAYWSGIPQDIWLNVAGRDPQGIVQPGAEYDQITAEITEALLHATDWQTGERLVRAVNRADQVYHGPYVNRACDLEVEWTQAFVGDYLRTTYHGRELLVPEPVPTDTKMTGQHRREGLLIAAGPNIAAGSPLPQAGIEDLAPTFLALMGVPTPGELDGHVLGELVGNAAATIGAAPEPVAVSAAGYTEEEEAAIEARLKDLGYL